MDIYSSQCFRGCLFVGLRMNLGNKEGWGGGVTLINKQHIDFLPLPTIPGKPCSRGASGRSHLHLR